MLAPEDTSRGTVTVAVTNASGTSNAVSATMQQVLPGLSVLDNWGRAVRYPDGAVINGTGAAEPGYTTTAAIGQGNIMALFGTGFGAVTGSPAVGRVFTGAYQTTTPVTVSIGGSSAEVLWAGLVGPGLYQINVRIPQTLADGDHAVLASIGGASTQTTARLKVAASAKLPTVLARNRESNFYPLQDRPALEQLVSFVGLGRPLAKKRGCNVEPFGRELLASEGHIVQIA